MQASFYLWGSVTTHFAKNGTRDVPVKLDLTRFPGGSASKESASNAGNPGSMPGSGRCPGEVNVNPLQYSSLENSMNRGAWFMGSQSWTRLSGQPQGWSLPLLSQAVRPVRGACF